MQYNTGELFYFIDYQNACSDRIDYLRIKIVYPAVVSIVINLIIKLFLITK